MLEKIKDSLELQLNIQYCACMGLYWMMYCFTLSFANAFLAGMGFGTAMIGFILALVYLLSLLIQQAVSIAVDRGIGLNLTQVITAMSLVLLVSQFCLARSEGATFRTGFFFLVGAIIVAAMLPFLNALNFHLEKCDVRMNYGVARGTGSALFFVGSLMIGKFMEDVSPKAAPVLSVIFTIIFLLVFGILLFNTRKFKLNEEIPFDPTRDETVGLDLSQVVAFYHRFRMFFILLLGIVGYYFGHMLICNFFYQIIVNVGGNTADNGGIMAIQAIVEVPCMFLFNKLADRFGTSKLLAVSGIMYTVKIFFTFIAHSVGMLYFSVLFQSVSFALFIPASVKFVNEIMDEKDAVKGQAFVTVAMTGANLLASIFGGILFGTIGCGPTLFLGTIVSIAGCVVAIYALIKINEK